MADITVYSCRFELLRTPAFFAQFAGDSCSVFAYPPSSALVYFLFYKVIPHPKYLYILFALLWSGIGSVASWLFCTRLLKSKKKGSLLAASLLLFTFPFLFVVQRGNIEIVAWSIITVGLLTYLRGHLYRAAILLGIAASIKLYPILLLGLFFSRRKDLGPAIAALLTFASVTLFALWFVGPSIPYAARGFLDGVTGFQSAYAEHIRASEIAFDHSLFSIFKLIAVDHGTNPSILTHPYYLIMGLLVTATFFLRINQLPFINRLAFLIAAMVLLPPVSYEYTLVHLYLLVPLLLVAVVGAPVKDRWQATGALGALGCTLCLLLPMGLYGTEHLFYFGQMQVVPLLLLMCLAAASPWNSFGTEAIGYRSSLSFPITRLMSGTG